MRAWYRLPCHTLILQDDIQWLGLSMQCKYFLSCDFRRILQFSSRWINLLSWTCYITSYIDWSILMLWLSIRKLPISFAIRYVFLHNVFFTFLISFTLSTSDSLQSSFIWLQLTILCVHNALDTTILPTILLRNRLATIIACTIYILCIKRALMLRIFSIRLKLYHRALVFRACT